MSSRLADKTLLVVGPGLIGGSMARALREQDVCARLLACGQDAADLEAGLQSGVFDAVSTGLGELAPEADIVVLAVPVLAVPGVLHSLLPHLRPQTIITDTASVKGHVVSEARRLLGDAWPRFVPGHPIAGSERSGFAAARADLFRGRKVILTPDADCAPHALHLVTRLWHQIGADVHGMSVARHDEVLAATSHLPHLLAFTLVNTLARREPAFSGGNAVTGAEQAQQERLQQIFDYAAGGFADFTRIAGSDPVMWRDIFLTNASASIEVLDAYIADLQQMREHLRQGDADALQRGFAAARATRNRFMDNFQAARQRRDRPAQPAPDVDPLPSESVSTDSLATALVLWLAAISDGVTEIVGYLDAGSSAATVALLRDLAVPVVGPENGQLRIYGVGAAGFLMPPALTWPVGEAGAVAASVLVAQGFAAPTPALATSPRAGALAALLLGLQAGAVTVQLPAETLDGALQAVLQAFAVQARPDATGWQLHCDQRPIAAGVIDLTSMF